MLHLVQIAGVEELKSCQSKPHVSSAIQSTLQKVILSSAFLAHISQPLSLGLPLSTAVSSKIKHHIWYLSLELAAYNHCTRETKTRQCPTCLKTDTINYPGCLKWQQLDGLRAPYKPFETPNQTSQIPPDKYKL